MSISKTSTGVNRWFGGKGEFACIPLWWIELKDDDERPRLRSRHLRILVMIARYAGKLNGRAYPSVRKMAPKAGLTHWQARAAIKDLVDWNLLSVKPVPHETSIFVLSTKAHHSELAARIREARKAITPCADASTKITHPCADASTRITTNRVLTEAAC